MGWETNWQIIEPVYGCLPLDDLMFVMGPNLERLAPSQDELPLRKPSLCTASERETFGDIPLLFQFNQTWLRLKPRIHQSMGNLTLLHM